MAIVYLVTNIENGKRYVGETQGTLKKRWYNHCRSAAVGSAFILHRAIRKYGRGSFQLKVLEEFETKALALAAEPGWIVKCGTLAPNGYNATEGGRGTIGFKHSEQERARRSARMKAVAKDPAWIEMKAEHGRAQWADPEISAQNRAAIEAGKHTPEYVAKVAAKKARTAALRAARRIAKGLEPGRMSRSDAAKAAHSSPEVRAKSAATASAQWADPEARAKLVAGNRAAKSTPEYLAAQSARSKAQWQDPDTRAKTIATMTSAEADARRALLKGRPCKCGRPRHELKDGTMRCSHCHAANELARKVANGDPTAGSRGKQGPQRKPGEPCPIDGTIERAANGECRECRCRARREANAAAGKPARGPRAPYKTRKGAQNALEKPEPPTLGAWAKAPRSSTSRGRSTASCSSAASRRPK